MSNQNAAVYTLFNECQDCYKCVRRCPVKSIRVQDGHACILSEKCIDAAMFSIKTQWGNDFFDGFASEAGDAWLSDTIWEALYEADYPVDSIYQYCDVEDDLSAEAHHDLIAFKNECTDTYLSIDCVVDMFIHLMNYHGAQIERIPAPFGTSSTDSVPERGWKRPVRKWARRRSAARAS